MNITEVRVRRVATGGKLKAFASITIDSVFVVHDLKVIEGQKGLFVAMPSRKTGNGEFKDIAHPIATEARALIQSKIIDEYNRLLAEDGLEPQEAAPIGSGTRDKRNASDAPTDKPNDHSAKPEPEAKAGGGEKEQSTEDRVND